MVVVRGDSNWGICFLVVGARGDKLFFLLCMFCRCVMGVVGVNVLVGLWWVGVLGSMGGFHSWFVMCGGLFWGWNCGRNGGRRWRGATDILPSKPQ